MHCDRQSKKPLSCMESRKKDLESGLSSAKARSDNEEVLHLGQPPNHDPGAKQEVHQ